MLTLSGATCPTIFRKVEDPDGVRGKAKELDLGVSNDGTLNCRRGDCADWYRVRLATDGMLIINARAMRGDKAIEPFRISLENGFGVFLKKIENVALNEQSLERFLIAGVYLIGLESTAESGPVGYQFSAFFIPVASAVSVDRPTQAPGTVGRHERPAAVKPRRIEAEVLEVEGSMADPTGVLLDLGRAGGAALGLRGQLREGGSLVGEIELVEIYEEGSRARLASPLLRPITPGVRAVIFLPAESRSMPSQDNDSLD